MTLRIVRFKITDDTYETIVTFTDTIAKSLRQM